MDIRLFFKLLFFIWTFSTLSCSSEKTTLGSSERGFDQEYLESLSEHDSYDYDREFETKSADPNDNNSSVWQIIAMIFSGIAWLFNSVLGYVIIAFLIGLLIWILVNKSDRIFEKKNPEEQERLLTEKPVEVEARDYHKLIQAALKRQDYRLAIRFGFLSALTYLHKKELIEWKIDKTNLEYQFELQNDIQEMFADMSLIYERIWYGEFAADHELFNQMTRKFNEIKSTQNS